MRQHLADRSLWELAKTYACAYLEEINDRAVFPKPEALEGLRIFEEPLAEGPGNPVQILRWLHEFGSPATVAQTGGRYFGFVNGGVIPAALAAKWLSDVWDQNCALYVMSPLASQLEAVCERWLVDLLGLPAGAAAGLVSGTSAATLCGLAAGRNELLRRLRWDVHAQGVFGAPRLRVVLGEQAHSSVFKALSLLGLGEADLVRAPVDTQGRLAADRMPPLDERTLVVAQAGNVNSGAFDPFEEICERAGRAGAWVHIDGAFGLWCAASNRRRSLTRGLDRADSWSVDAHKTLNAPYDCGIVLCKNRETLRAAMRAQAAYLQYSENRDGMVYTLDMSRRARAVELWAALKYLGRSGVAELVDGSGDLAERFAEKLQAQGFQVRNEVVFNQVLVSGETPEETTATLKNIQESGECWCGGAVWNNEPVIRISVCSWATTAQDVDRSVAAFVKAREKAR
ncbi:MAG: aminotransferase class V-fold PLP-dependent enzyme [Thermodesulfobacteriota bacterium]